jgi:hypothetical protein
MHSAEFTVISSTVSNRQIIAGCNQGWRPNNRSASARTIEMVSLISTSDSSSCRFGK